MKVETTYCYDKVQELIVLSYHKETVVMDGNVSLAVGQQQL